MPRAEEAGPGETGEGGLWKRSKSQEPRGKPRKCHLIQGGFGQTRVAKTGTAAMAI